MRPVVDFSNNEYMQQVLTQVIKLSESGPLDAKVTSLVSGLSVNMQKDALKWLAAQLETKGYSAASDQIQQITAQVVVGHQRITAAWLELASGLETPLLENATSLQATHYRAVLIADLSKLKPEEVLSLAAGLFDSRSRLCRQVILLSELQQNLWHSALCQFLTVIVEQVIKCGPSIIVSFLQTLDQKGKKVHNEALGPFRDKLLTATVIAQLQPEDLRRLMVDGCLFQIMVTAGRHAPSAHNSFSGEWILQAFNNISSVRVCS